jgi:hypothetical protein
VWNFLSGLFGEVTPSELVLVAVLFAAILLFSWAPRLGEAVGGLFDDEDEREPPSDR